jgi:UDP-N-acetylglucosamine/UDP-N-acetylgalactosamine diphosphorylase
MESVTSAITSTLEKLHLRSLQEDNFEPPSPEQIATLRQKYTEQTQEHVFTFFDSLPPSSQAKLYNQLLNIDPVRLTSISETVLAPHNDPRSPIGIEHEPLPSESCASTLDASPETLDKWHNAGLKAIAEGKVAVLLMAGGQGTRLGSTAPKGCYDIGLPSGKSLFQLQAERLVKLQELAAENFGDKGKEVVIPWYIMTSGPTRKDTEDFLKSKNFFGLKVFS